MNHPRATGAVRRWLKPAWAAILATSAVSVAAAGAAPGASAAPISQCTPHSGTIVAVDFEHWGGPIVRGCGVRQRSGYDLLHAAGFTTAGDQHDGPAFICRLGNAAFHAGTQYPTPGQEDCVLTPPAAAYWSYWIAPAGQNHWTYSQLGAMGEVPKPGEVQVWIFGGTNIAGTHGSGVPKFSPAALRAHDPPPATQPTTQPTSAHRADDGASTTTHPSASPTHTKHIATSPPAAPATATATTSTPHGPHHPAAHARASHPAASQHQSHPGHSPSAPQTATTQSRADGSSSSATTPEPQLVNARATKEPTSSSSAAPLVIGIGLALLLCAGAGWTIWQRRRYE
jgi:hypothetical protein